MKKDGKKEDLDAFWDISELVPRKKMSPTAHSRRTSIDCADVELGERVDKPVSRSDSDTLIKRYIPRRGDGRITSIAESFEAQESYSPKDSLIHKVVLKKQKCTYRYYGEFLDDAKKLNLVQGKECAYVPFFSYAPQYNQLSAEQLEYYLWFRENVRHGVFIKTDYSYVLLYIYELINLGGGIDVKESQKILVCLWKEYHKSFPALSSKLADWICDFSLLHRLPPPIVGGSELASRVMSLKEFYIAMPRGDMEGCARSLLSFCTSYDFHKSKFYTEENRTLFDRHIFGALVRAVRYYSVDGRLLSGISFNDSKLMRDAYAGAICASEQKYRIEVEFCSFSRSNELRFLVGDIIKYSENKLRTYIGVKSKMTVYSLPNDLRDILDAYFLEELPSKRHSRVDKEKTAYEALYEVPMKPLSLSDAAKIESESWQTTKELIDAFEISEVAPIEEKPLFEEPFAPQAEVGEDTDILAHLAEYRELLAKMLGVDCGALLHFASENGKMPETLADEINELAFEVIGDSLIEECDGGYEIIEDYRELLN